MNGWYERQGTSNDKPKYHQIGGTGIIYCRRNWKINNQDNEGGWYYSRAESGGTPPEGQWTTEGYGGSDADPPPTLTAHSSMDDGDSSASGLDIEIHLWISSQDKKSHILSEEPCHFQIGECCSVQM